MENQKLKNDNDGNKENTMNKLNTFLISTLIIILLSGSVVANEWPSPPNIWDAIDTFYTYHVEEGGNLSIMRVYCYVIEGKTVVNPYYPDNGCDYVTIYMLTPREDGLLTQENYPSSYWFDIDKNGTFSDEESLFDPTPDGWNGNEVALEDLVNESNL